MTAANPRVTVYTQNLVLTPNSQAALTKWAEAITDPDYRKMCLADIAAANMASDIATAGFNTVIVGLFHVHKQGQLYYNDISIDSDTIAAVYEGITELKTTPGSTVEMLFISFGGGPGVSDDDYPNIKANWPAFKPVLLNMLHDLGANGVDWDYEPDLTFDSGLIIQLTNEVAAADFMVTAAPYGDSNISNWESVITGTLNPNENNFAWWNLQTYGPTTTYSYWVSSLQKLKTGINANGIQGFLMPGYQPFCISSPKDELENIRRQFPYLRGAFIWNYNEIKDCAAQQAADIKSALTG